TTLNQEPLEDSTFDLNFGPRSMAFDARFFADKIRANLNYPRVPDAPLAFSFEADNWDFSGLLGLVGGPNVKRDYETSLSAKVNLVSDEGRLWRSRGEARVSRFYVRHGTAQMQNAKPIVVRFNDGLVSVENLRIDGDNT